MLSLDVSRLCERASLSVSRTWPGAMVDNPRPLEGGISSITVVATLRRPHSPDALVVLKVAPPGLPAIRNRDVLRQARLLIALDPIAEVPTPRVLAMDEGSPNFFVMDMVNGDSHEPFTGVAGAPPPGEGVVYQRFLTAARTLAAIHRVPPDLPPFLEEHRTDLGTEIARWESLLATVDPSLCPRADELAAGLRATLPRALTPALVHGDFRLGNLLFDGVRLNAVIDWELWALSDPRIDLAWLLMHIDPPLRFAIDRRESGIRRPSVPTTSEVLDSYATGGGCAILTDIEWFLALAHFRISAAVAGIVKRGLRRAVPPPEIEVAARTIPETLDRGLAILANASRF